MKKLLVSLILCLFPVNLLAVEIINGGSPTDFVKCSRTTKSLIHSIDYDVKKFINSYKKSTIKKFLKQIRVCHVIDLDGMTWVGGTYDVRRRIIYLRAPEHYKHEYLLHHEFSSIILKSPENRHKRLSVLKEFWKINDGSYTGVGRVNKSNWLDEVASYQRRGFVVPYAQTNFENDFNMTAAYLKTSSLSYNTKMAKRFKRLKSKFKIVQQFYKNL